jgi:hypothetical protein
LRPRCGFCGISPCSAALTLDFVDGLAFFGILDLPIGVRIPASQPNFQPKIGQAKTTLARDGPPQPTHKLVFRRGVGGCQNIKATTLLPASEKQRNKQTLEVNPTVIHKREKRVV